MRACLAGATGGSGNGELSHRRTSFLISKGWVQGVLLVVLFGFFVLGLLAYRTTAQPAGPGAVVDPAGESSSPARTSARVSRCSCTTA